MPTAWRWHRAGDMEVMFRFEAAEQWATERREAVTVGMPRSVADEWTFTAWTLRRVRSWLEGQRRAVVIVDTLAAWGGIEDENDAAQATGAVMAWTRLAQESGACVLLVHHVRKSGGNFGEAIRGSSAILGTADGSWEIGRVSEDATDTRRRVNVLSRMAFPTELTIAYDPDSGAYSVAEPVTAAVDEWLSVIPPDGDGLTINDLAGLWEVSRQTAQRRATTLLDGGRIRRAESRSGRSIAWRYWSVDSTPVGTFRDIFAN
jgi:hypothetical protein